MVFRALRAVAAQDAVGNGLFAPGPAIHRRPGDLRLAAAEHDALLFQRNHDRFPFLRAGFAPFAH